MPDIFLLNTTCKISWIKGLFDYKITKWKTLTWKLLGVPEHIFIKKSPITLVNSCLTNFHKQLFQSWFSVNNTFPTDVKSIVNEYLFDSDMIKCNSISLTTAQIGIKDKINNRYLKIIDILDKQNGKIIDF